MMKHIFIVNPISGRHTASQEIYGSLSKLPSDVSAEVYVTKSKGDGERYIREYLSKNSESVRFYACGGDGTLNEVVNGIAPFPQASFSVFPCGSGNDFVKCFGSREAFLDIPALVSGEEKLIDIMKVNDRFCVNICHFGFDSYVASKMNEVRSKKIIGGKHAYTTGVVLGFLNAMKSHAIITADGETLCGGDFLFCTVANGKYVGGKYLCAPNASVDDGLLDICVASTASRFTFIRLVKYYANGSHLTDPRFKKYLKYRRCRHVTIEGGEDFKISLDGEVVNMPRAEIDIVPNGVKLALPKTLI